jgi:spore coat protein YutH
MNREGAISLQQAIYEMYGIQPTSFSDIFGYDGFSQGHLLYTIIPASSFSEEEARELFEMGQHLIAKGDKEAGLFLQNKEGKLISEWQDEKFMLCRHMAHSNKSFSTLGEELALFHERGKMMYGGQEKIHRSRFGNWKELWATRHDQMEKFWILKVRDHPNDEMDKRLIESFPYYSGLTENAIQYLVDTEIDDLPRAFDTATVCHHRFTKEIWSTEKFVKFPMDWVYDHPSRDLSEYIRTIYFQEPETFQASMYAFLEKYERKTPLSSFAWRLLYARLLCPLHYFELVEGFYSTNNEDLKEQYRKELEDMLHTSGNYESFLGEFYRLLGISTTRYYIPEIPWLSS